MKVFAGPWIGEFGWELFHWQGVLRQLHDNGMDITICTSESSFDLYRDFCTDFVQIIPGTETDAWRCNNWKPNITLENVTKKLGAIISPEDICPGEPNPREQKLIKYGHKDDKLISNDIIIHARATNKCNSAERNWPVEKWEQLIDMIPQEFTVGCIGKKDSAYLIDGCDDMLDVDLGFLANFLQKSKLVLGPSSGPIHFASLCGVPHMVWSGYDARRNRWRYEDFWNPFNTKVHFLDCGWNPSVAYIYEELMGLL